MGVGDAVGVEVGVDVGVGVEVGVGVTPTVEPSGTSAKLPPRAFALALLASALLTAPPLTATRQTDSASERSAE